MYRINQITLLTIPSNDIVISSYNFHDLDGSTKYIYVIHGIGVRIFEPPKSENIYKVSVSDISHKHYKTDKLIYNGVDLDEFNFTSGPSKVPRSVLYLSRYYLPYEIYYACETMNIKIHQSKWDEDIVNKIHDADFVITHGRGAYESMACGRPVFVYSSFARDFEGRTLCDGWVKKENFKKLLTKNCSGWVNRHHMKNIDDFKKAFAVYDSDDGGVNRQLAEKYLSSKIFGDKYEEVFNELGVAKSGK